MIKKNVAVIGCGHWGKNLVRNFYDLGALSAVCDPNKDLAKHFAKQYDVKNLDFKQILADENIHGVVLAVPAPLHASMAIQSMNAGKDVYVEKPLAMNNTEAEAMIASAKNNEAKLMVGHLLQYHPIFMKVRSLVSSGKLGRLSYIYSNRLSLGKVRSEEDVIWSFAPHDISMILSLADADLLSVRTESSKILQENIADCATVHLEFKSKLKAHISVSWLHPFKEQKLVVIGSNGMIVFDDTQIWSKKLAFYNHVIHRDENLLNIEKADVEYVHVPESEPLRNECQHFIDVINKNIKPITNGEEGLRVLSVLSAATLLDSDNNANITVT
jgi:UDP-2-acetamido-3-amino-2,3-dideoxy-glucuronate N-acetyltransferase